MSGVFNAPLKERLIFINLGLWIYDDEILNCSASVSHLMNEAYKPFSNKYISLFLTIKHALNPIELPLKY